MSNSFYILLFFSISLLACKSELNHEELIEYVNEEDNGLIKTKQLGKTIVELVYKPSDLLIQQDLSNKENSTQEEIEKIKSNYNNSLYFTLNLSVDGQELEVGGLQSKEKFAKRVELLSFGMRDRIQIKTSKNDSVSLLDYAYPRMYGVTGKSTMLLVFDRSQATDGEWFDVIVNGYDLGVGINKFRFNTKDIEEVPQLDFNRSEDDDKK